MNASASSCELETVRAFSLSAKRARVPEMFSNRKRRATFVNGLAYFRDFDPRYIVPIPPASQNPAAIEALLTARRAPPQCHVLSEWELWDGRDMQLSEALKQIVGKGMGTLLCCIPGRLAFFENEDGRYILEHPTNKEQKR